MESIMQYISVHWVSWVLGIISVLLSGAYHKLSKQLKADRARTDAINAGVLALLHDRLYQACTFYLKRKYCTLEDRDNLEYMFRPYKALGGNGTGEVHDSLRMPGQTAPAHPVSFAIPLDGLTNRLWPHFLLESLDGCCKWR